MEGLYQSALFQRFWQIAGSASIRVKVLGIVLGVVLLLGAITTIQMRQALTATLESELEQQAIAVAERLSPEVSDLLTADGGSALSEALLDWRLHYTGGGHNTLVDYVMVEDATGEPIAVSLAEQVTSTVPPRQPLGDDDELVVTRFTSPWGAVTEVTLPVEGHPAYLRIGFGEDNIEQTVATVTVQIITLTVLMIAVGFVAAAFLTWVLTRPILSLVQAARAVAESDFTQEVPRWANDEIGDLAEAFNSMTRALAVAESERRQREAIREQYIRGVIEAQEEERKRIARELHDSTSQSLTSLLIGLRRLEEAGGPDETNKEIGELRDIISHTLAELHALAWQLRPSVLDDLGLAVALQRYVAEFERRHGVHVDLLIRGIDDRLAVELETTIYRIVQEALTNVARHARAANASVLIERRPDGIRLIVEDDGVGFDPASAPSGQSNLGLQGIRERTQLLGGSMTIESQPGQGTGLFVEIPLASESIAAEGEEWR